MSGWSEDELARAGGASEWGISSVRADGSLRPYVTVWGVRVGDDVYVRSAYGPENGWFRRARASGTGRVRAGGAERDVTFAAAGGDVGAAVDAAYREKYAGYPSIVDGIVGPQLHDLTLRLDAR